MYKCANLKELNLGGCQILSLKKSCWERGFTKYSKQCIKCCKSVNQSEKCTLSTSFASGTYALEGWQT